MVATFFPESCSMLLTVELPSPESVNVLAIPAIMEVAKISVITIHAPAIILPRKVTGAISP